MREAGVGEVQPHVRDRVHTVWVNGPSYPDNLKPPVWPGFGSGSTHSGTQCDLSQKGERYTGYVGDTGRSGYCRPASAEFVNAPWHLLVHSGR